MSAASSLASLLDSAETIGQKAAPSKQDEPFIRLEGDETIAFDTFASAKAITDLAKNEEGLARSETIETALRHYIRLCIEAGGMVSNPQVVSIESSAKFEVKHKGEIAEKTDPAGKPLSIEKQLAAAGLSKAVVAEIVGTMIVPEVTLRSKNLVELENNDKQEVKIAARKLADLIKKNFTKGQQSILFESKTENIISKRWKEYSIALAIKLGNGNEKKAAEFLEKLWSVIPVQFALSGVKFDGDVSKAFERLRSPRPALSLHSAG